MTLKQKPPNYISMLIHPYTKDTQTIQTVHEKFVFGQLEYQRTGVKDLESLTWICLVYMHFHSYNVTIFASAESNFRNDASGGDDVITFGYGKSTRLDEKKPDGMASHGGYEDSEVEGHDRKHD